MGRLSQTKYYLSDFSSKTTIIRRHHPLNGQELERLSVGKTTVVVRLSGNYNYKMGVARIKRLGESKYKKEFRSMSFAPRNIV